MSSIDPQLFFRVKESQYFDLLYYQPCDVDVLDVVNYENGSVEAESHSLGPDELEAWLHKPFPPKAARRSLRIILGASTSEVRLPMNFPSDILNIRRPRNIPFHQKLFRLILKKFNLPGSTPWLFYTSTGHFQRYTLKAPESDQCGFPHIGVTMRRTSRGILAIDLALSLSHCPKSGATYAVLLGHSPLQAAFIKQQISELCQIAHHPAFLPTLICTYHRTLLQRLCDEVIAELFNVETDSGQTMAPVWDEYGPLPLGNCEDADITKRVLGVIQLGSAWEAYARVVLSDVEAIQELVDSLQNGCAGAHQDSITEEGQILRERLTFLGEKGKLILWKLIYFTKRAQAQQNAIYNYIALRNNEVNRALAYDSRELAAASKRDSYAMKSISIITMVLLPGTFVATLFATPAIAETSPAQWIYWLVTLLLTFTVIGAWYVWWRWTSSLVDAEFKNRQRLGNTVEVRS